MVAYFRGDAFGVIFNGRLKKDLYSEYQIGPVSIQDFGAYILNTSEVYQKLANKYQAAFRVNNTTYVRKKDEKK